MKAALQIRLHLIEELNICFQILNSLKMLPRHEKKVPHESLLYLDQIALSKVHFSGTVRDAAGEEDPNTVVSRKSFHSQFSVVLD